MGEEEIESVNEVKMKDEEAEEATAETTRLTMYMQITAVATCAIVMAIGSLLLYHVRSVVVIFALAFLAAYVVSPAVRFFERRGINRVLVVSVLYVAFVAVVIVSVLLLLPVFWGEVKDLQAGIQSSLTDPEFKETIKAKLQDTQEWLTQTFPQLENVDLNAQLDIEENASKAALWALSYVGGAITTYGGKLVWLLVVIFLTPFITFFLLKDGAAMRKAVMRLVPGKHAEVAVELVQKVDSQIGRYIRGRIAESIILSVLTIIGLWILNVKYYLVIGGVAGFANLIPYIGPVMVAIPAIILAAYQHGVASMIATSVFLGGLQVVDNAILVPLVVGKSVDLHPVVTIFVVFVGGQLLGLLGMIIALPLTATIIAVFQTVYKEFNSLPACE